MAYENNNAGSEDTPEEDTRGYMKRLQEDVKRSYEATKGYREQRRKRLEMLVGPNYADTDEVGFIMTGSRRTRYLDYFGLALKTYRSKLISGIPQAHITSDIPELRRASVLLEKTLNKHVQDIDLKTTLQQVVMDALLGYGVVKIGLQENTRPSMHGDPEEDPGVPYCERVSPDDFIWDFEATDIKGAAWMANYYRVPEDVVKQSGDYNTDQIPENSAIRKEMSRDLESDPDNRAEAITKRKYDPELKYMDQLELCDIWLPWERRVLTVLGSDFSIILRDIPWEGPEEGPFKILGLEEVPDNSLPLAPSAAWQDAAELIGSLHRKLARQAMRQKTLTGVRTGFEEDAEKIKRASDGDIIPLENPEMTKDIGYGGVDNQQVGYIQMLTMEADKAMGNLNALAGLGPSSETVGQDRLISESVSQSIKDLAEKVQHFVAEIQHDLAYWIHTDDVSEIPVSIEIPGTDQRVVAYYGPDDREEAKFWDLNIELIPYSLTYQTPGDKLEVILQNVMQIYMPLMQQAAEQGIMLDLRELFNLIARNSNTPELMDVLSMMAPPMTQTGPATAANQTPNPGAGQGPMKPPATTRTYVRENRPGRSPDGHAQQLQQAFLGMDTQDSEKAALSPERR